MMKAVPSGIPKSSEIFGKTAREKSCLGPTDFLLTECEFISRKVDVVAPCFKFSFYY